MQKQNNVKIKKEVKRNIRRINIFLILINIFSIVVIITAVSFSLDILFPRIKVDSVSLNTEEIPKFENVLVKREDILSEKVNNITTMKLEKTDEFVSIFKEEIMIQAAKDRGEYIYEIIPTEPSKNQLLATSFNDDGFITANILNLRSEPSTDSEIKGFITYNKPVLYYAVNDEWAAIKSVDDEGDDEIYYINLNYITGEELPYEYKVVSGDKRKSFEDYRAITLKTSRQYKIQQRYAVTDPETGIRMVDGKYLIGLGSYFTHNVGQFVDLVLANGEVIPCIIGDAKKNKDTNANNSVGNDGSVAEFIVDRPCLDRYVSSSGNICNVKPEWNSQVVGIRLYSKNLLQY